MFQVANKFGCNKLEYRVGASQNVSIVHYAGLPFETLLMLPAHAPLVMPGKNAMSAQADASADLPLNNSLELTPAKSAMILILVSSPM